MKALHALPLLRLFTVTIMRGTVDTNLVSLDRNSLSVIIINRLILTANLLFLFKYEFTKQTINVTTLSVHLSPTAFFIICVYHRYFNEGITIILLTTFGVLGLNNLK
jgi:hypothetical protein